MVKVKWKTVKTVLPSEGRQLKQNSNAFYFWTGCETHSSLIDWQAVKTFNFYPSNV